MVVDPLLDLVRIAFHDHFHAFVGDLLDLPPACLGELLDDGRNEHLTTLLDDGVHRFVTFSQSAQRSLPKMTYRSPTRLPLAPR